ncbi:MAG: hypothetical protein KatS3mg010_1921 [Acidimicrobiia bacterium]|nr:MAG: hypothetical protein KatS3mg010_1921 [Acidimicrobiia bacterium]
MTMLLMQLDLPAPVCPAISTCGNVARLLMTARPAMSRPMATSSGWVAFFASSLARMSPSVTSGRVLLGTSTPIALRPGIGARMRTSWLAIEYAISLASPVTLETFTPGASSSS